MIKVVLFDIDGVLNKSEMFSIQYQKKFGVSNDAMLPFFNGVFGKCITGDADLKVEVEPWLQKWKWEGNVDEFLKFWFEAEDQIDPAMMKHVNKIKERNVRVFLATNQEKYRTEFLWNNNNFIKIFETIFSSSSIGYKKKNHKFWKYVMSELSGLDKKEVLLWDDDDENVNSAKEYGLHAELFTTNKNFLQVMDLKYNL